MNEVFEERKEDERFLIFRKEPGIEYEFFREEVENYGFEERRDFGLRERKCVLRKDRNSGRIISYTYFFD